MFPFSWHHWCARRLPYCLDPLRSVAMSMTCVTVDVHEVWSISDPYILFLPCRQSFIISEVYCTVPLERHSAQLMASITIVCWPHDRYCPIMYTTPIPSYVRDLVVSCLYNIQFTALRVMTLCNSTLCGYISLSSSWHHTWRAIVTVLRVIQFVVIGHVPSQCFSPVEILARSNLVHFKFQITSIWDRRPRLPVCCNSPSFILPA